MNPTLHKWLGNPWPQRDGENSARGLPGYPRDAEQDAEIVRSLGFDPDSPDLADPQIDPPQPPHPPPEGPSPQRHKRAPGEQYPPYGD